MALTEIGTETGSETGSETGTGTGSVPKWTNNFTFLAAAIGSAVGISNIWKFTYVAGAHGGGAFVLVYVLALLAIALPALIAELTIGRHGGRSVVGTLETMAHQGEVHRHWRLFGLVCMIGVFLAMSFYAVIAGWTIDYFTLGVSGRFDDLTAEASPRLFAAMTGDPVRMAGFMALFIALTATIVALGLKRGVERFLAVMTPGLFVILGLLLVYAIATTDFLAGAAFLFAPDFAKLTPSIVLMAVGQSFFSLGVGLGVILTIGAYTQREVNLARSATVIALADGGVALVAGLAIFPIVLHYGLSPAQGPGLLFETLPIAFAEMPMGRIIGPAFFLLMALAALTSTVTILESVVANFEDRSRWRRGPATWSLALALAVMGLATVLSFNRWQDARPLGFLPVFAERNVFEILDYVVSNIIMPGGGICVAIIAGWLMHRSVTLGQTGLGDGILYRLWRFSVRYLVPFAIGAVLVLNL